MKFIWTAYLEMLPTLMSAKKIRRIFLNVANPDLRKRTQTQIMNIDQIQIQYIMKLIQKSITPVLFFQLLFIALKSIFSDLNIVAFYNRFSSFIIISKLVYMQKVSILPLGAGCQVGRSCIILTINNKKIMLDCGLMINKGGQQALPLFDKFNVEDLSMVIITHAHLDHCGALPYFLSRYNYKKKVYMTKPTKHIYNYLVRDTLKVRNEDKVLFTKQQVDQSIKRICEVTFGVQKQQQGIKITPYVAGHIVGAAMFVIEVDGVKVLYTGDFSCEEDRYIMQAQIPPTNVDILISESTFGVSVHHDRHIREQNFREQVRKIVKRGGKCLLPVFSAGRAQELLFILDQFWDQNLQQFQDIKIFYTIQLIEKCKSIYQTYIDMLSEKIRERFYKQTRNPFQYKHIHYLRSKQRIQQYENGPLVVMCTPGMLQNGQSRTLLERWCHDEKNGVIITGYCAQGSVASNLKKSNTIVSMADDKKQIRSKLSVQDISFAAHADCLQTVKFVNKVKPMYVILVHGSSKNAQSLKQHLQKQFPEIKQVSCPKNQQLLEFEIQITEKYLIAGELISNIETIMKNKKQVISQFDGYIVNTENHKILINKNDKDKLFPQLKGMEIFEKITVKYQGTLTLAQLLAQRIFGDAELGYKEGNQYLIIKKNIWMSLLEPNKTALVEFISSPKNDIIADQFCYLLSNILYDPFLEKNLNKLPSQETVKQNWAQVYQLVLEDYPESTLSEQLIMVKRKGDNIALVNLRSKSVDCRDQYTKMRLLGIMEDLIEDPLGKNSGMDEEDE